MEHTETYTYCHAYQKTSNHILVTFWQHFDHIFPIERHFLCNTGRLTTHRRQGLTPGACNTIKPAMTSRLQSPRNGLFIIKTHPAPRPTTVTTNNSLIKLKIYKKELSINSIFRWWSLLNFWYFILMTGEHTYFYWEDVASGWLLNFRLDWLD